VDSKEKEIIDAGAQRAAEVLGLEGGKSQWMRETLLEGAKSFLDEPAKPRKPKAKT